MFPQLLTEISYFAPKNGETLFWDFYALYTIWFRLGSGYEQSYGQPFHPGVITTDMRRRVTDKMFAECVQVLSKAMIQWLEEACVGESSHLHHATDEFFDFAHRMEDSNEIKDKKSIEAKIRESGLNKLPRITLIKLLKWVSKNDIDQMGDEWADDEGFVNVGMTIEDAYYIFGLEWSGLYGGYKWKEAALLCMKLKKNLGGDVKYLYPILDRIYDLHHHTGHILSNGPLEVAPRDLDSRAGIKDIRQFYPHVSQPVLNLLRSSAHLMDLPKLSKKKEVSIMARMAKMKSFNYYMNKYYDAEAIESGNMSSFELDSAENQVLIQGGMEYEGKYSNKDADYANKYGDRIEFFPDDTVRFWDHQGMDIESEEAIEEEAEYDSYYTFFKWFVDKYIPWYKQEIKS